MSKAIVNALTLALMSWRDKGIDIQSAKAFAEEFVAENAELFTAPLPVKMTQEEFAARQPGEDPFVGRKTVVGISPLQQAAMDKGIPLCPNCQQPVNHHLVGCARATGENPKAVTKLPLTPVA